jgi:dTDP-4-amino-4,6-dideoxygalactose transaminase
MFSGRTAIYHGLRVLRISAGQRVLVPAFHCASLVDPIRRLGATPVFYRVGPDCSPDFEDIRRRIDAATRAIVAIHYFGFPQPLERFRELRAERGVYLIEDCAHVLAGEGDSRPLGTTGDVSIFSWRKFLPLNDGGQLVVNNPALTVDIRWDARGPLGRVKAIKDVVDRILESSPRIVGPYLSKVWRVPSVVRRHLMSKRAPKTGSGSTMAPTAGVEFDLGSPFTLVNLPMSTFSRFIVDRVDFASVIERRRANYRYLRQTIGSIPGVTPLFEDLPSGVCPLAFPFFVEDRKDFHLALRARGIPASTWGGVIHPDLPLHEFPDSRDLYERLVYLPVHQSLSLEEMDMMSAVIRDALSAAR